MDEKRYQELAEKWLNGTITAAEKLEFTDWYNSKGANKKILVPDTVASGELAHGEKLWQKIQDRIPPVVDMPSRRSRSSWLAAASIILLLGVGALFFLLNKPGKQPVVAVQTQPAHDAYPGRDAAMLTLADGRRIFLDSTTGTITKTDGITVVNTNGLLSYQQENNTAEKPTYHTITTARGNQYQLLLPDGSHIWLNAGSSITYPTAFVGNERTVSVTGEAYFEVTHDKTKPFKVTKGSMTIEVLGTHFNVNAYDDENDISVTLLEGSVKVSATQPETRNLKPETILSPGQQAQLNAQKLTTTNNVDIDAVMAWKEGFFQFDFTTTSQMLRQLSRWYDVDIQYEGQVKERQFGGRINRKQNLSEVLNMLKGANLKFRIEGKKLIVTP